jgi:uncharacterized membrane protein YgcG
MLIIVKLTHDNYML